MSNYFIYIYIYIHIYVYIRCVRYIRYCNWLLLFKIQPFISKLMSKLSNLFIYLKFSSLNITLLFKFIFHVKNMMLQVTVKLKNSFSFWFLRLTVWLERSFYKTDCNLNYSTKNFSTKIFYPKLLYLSRQLSFKSVGICQFLS